MSVYTVYISKAIQGSA